MTELQVLCSVLFFLALLALAVWDGRLVDSIKEAIKYRRDKK